MYQKFVDIFSINFKLFTKTLRKIMVPMVFGIFSKMVGLCFWPYLDVVLTLYLMD